MFCANTRPAPDATTDLGVISPVIRSRRVSSVAAASTAGTVVTGAGGAVITGAAVVGARASLLGAEPAGALVSASEADGVGADVAEVDGSVGAEIRSAFPPHEAATPSSATTATARR